MATRIPISKDHAPAPFDGRQKKIWENMEHDMERRRREWEDEIDKMRSEFFNLRPEKGGAGGVGGGGALDFDRLDGPHSAHGPPAAGMVPRLASKPGGNSSEDGKPVIEKDERGQPVFKVRFNMYEYRPEEVNVKMDNNKIMVSAKHEEKSGGSSVSREYNREVNVPVEVDPLALQCFFQPDGYLVFSAPMPAPKYDAIREAPSHHSPHSTSSVKSSSSYQTSSSNNKLNGNDSGIGLGHASPQMVPTHHSMGQPQQQHHHTKVHHINQQHSTPPPPTHSSSFPKPAPSPSFPSSSSSSSSSKFSSSNVGSSENADMIVPSFRAPPDINKLLDQPPATMPPLHSSPLSKPPPFNTLSSTFPAGPIFPDSSQQIQLSAPTVTSHDGKFQLTMPIDDFKPEELSVKTQDRKVIICAKRTVSSGNRNHTSEMNREHSLPDNVDPLTVKAFFTDTNMLIVEAPFLRG